MRNTIEILKEKLVDIIFFAVVVGIILLIFFIKWCFEKDILECTQTDLYTINDWEVCGSDGFQNRKIEKLPDFSCKNPGKVEKPEEKRTCEYIPACIESDWKISEWSLCINGKQTRQVEKISKCEGGFVSPEKEQVCSQKILNLFEESKKVHTTIIENGYYSKEKNHNNLEVKSNGKFKKIILTIKANVSHKTSEYYYVFFGIDKNYAAPRVLGTSRIQNNRLDLKDLGIFQGTDTPKKLSFDLARVKLANESSDIGSKTENYLSLFNENENMKMTLFLADGISMTTDDLTKRIDGTITDAWFEYECKDNSDCSIERIPSLQ